MDYKNFSFHTYNFYTSSNTFLISGQSCSYFRLNVRAATAGKAGKDWSFPRFWDTLTLSQPGGAD